MASVVAHISNPDIGVRSLRPELFAADLLWLQRTADGEVRRILAGSEPAQEQGRSGHWFQCQPSRTWGAAARCHDESGAYSGTAWAAHGALADALAAFVWEAL